MGDRIAVSVRARTLSAASTRGAQQLAGQQVAFAGRLTILSRIEARRLVAQLGGSAVVRVTADTTVLVVGQGELPLAASGRLSRNLRRAVRLRQQGHAIRIEDEVQWLARLRGDSLEEVAQYFTLAEVAQIVGVPTRRVRSWVQMGLLEPCNRESMMEWFDYRQLSIAKTLIRLQGTPGGRRRLGRSLRQLSRLMPDRSALLERLVGLDFNGPLLWRSGDGCLLDPTGQMHFEFAEAETACLPLAAPSEAVDYFQQGCQAEAEGRLADAEAIYRRALAADHQQPDVHFNLGNVLAAMQRHAEAADCFQQTLQLDPCHAEACNNLGVVLAEQGQIATACGLFERAVQLDRSYADAIYNLADALDQCGRTDESCRYWRRYLHFDRTSQWAQFARLRAEQRTVTK